MHSTNPVCGGSGLKRGVFLLSVALFALFGIPFHVVSGAELTPEINRAIQRGVTYLRKNAPESGGTGSLAAYAMMVGDESPKSPKVKKILDHIVAKVKNGKYQRAGYIYYEAGVDMMALEAADPVKYRPQMEAIVQYIIEKQKSYGGWYYPPPRPDTGGDTSITQYALLGLWAAARAGIDVPPEVWNKAAAWHVKTQMQSGAFTYQPPMARSSSYHAMTTGGIGSLYICRMYLYPDSANPLKPKKRQPKPKTKFGVLERINRDTGKSAKKKGTAPTNYTPRTSLAAINGAISRGAGWFGAHYAIGNSGAQYQLYYVYTLERMASLADLQTIAGRDWYQDGAAYLLESQSKEGTWSSHSGAINGTAFAVLFLGRATGKRLGPIGPRYQEGLMRGGNELTIVGDFSELEVRNGVVIIKKNLGPLDDLLAELTRPRSTKIAATTNAILEKIQSGDREELIGKKDKLLKLVKDPRPDVRRIALWALARTADFEDVSTVMKLLDDPNIDVVIEAHNALRWISRNPRGIGMPNSPLAGLSEEATEEQRNQAFKKWHNEVRKRWKTWYLKVRPYEQRNDIEEVKKK